MVKVRGAMQNCVTIFVTIYRLCSLTAAVCPDTEKFELILTFRGALAGGQDNSGQQRPGGGGAAEYE